MASVCDELSFNGNFGTVNKFFPFILTDGLSHIRISSFSNTSITYTVSWSHDGITNVFDDSEIILGSSSFEYSRNIRARYVKISLLNNDHPAVSAISIQTLLFDSPTSSLDLENVGGGAEVYKENSHKIRSIISNDNSIKIQELAEEINILTNPGSVSLIDTQVFTTIGANTWNKPIGTKYIRVLLIGGGGGGGSGRKGSLAFSNSCGVAGQGGNIAIINYHPVTHISSASITIGAGGAGGASQTIDSTIGNNGVVGGNTSITLGNRIITALGGALGAGGTTSISGSNLQYATCSIYTSPFFLTPAPPEIPEFFNGWLNSTDRTVNWTYTGYTNPYMADNQTPGSGFLGTYYNVTTGLHYPPQVTHGFNLYGRIIQGTPISTPNSNGIDGGTYDTYFGLGGSGAYWSSGTGVYKGGSGGLYGGGGGSGHNGENAVRNSGAGGDGGQGVCVVWSYA